jgi:tetratricopeptide (TPR) repeat protein
MDEAPRPRAEGGRFRYFAAVIVVAIAVITAYWYFTVPDSKPAVSMIALEDDPDRLVDPVAVNPGYVGAQACAPCHGERTHQFLETRHAVACVAPRPDHMPKGFQLGQNTLQSYEPTLRFEMRIEGTKYIQTAVKRSDGETRRYDHTVGFVYGSGGELDEVFFSWSGDRLMEMPAAWLHPQNRWGHVNFSRQTADPARPAAYRCLECHNVWFENIPSVAGNRYRPESFITSVGCEHCHGPARDHIRFHQTNPDETIGQKIVKPRELTRDRKVDLCAQCHGNGYKNRGPARSFRAGDSVEDHFRIGVSRLPEEDHVANQTKYMKESRCYQESESLTCTTCHNPHKPTDRTAVRGACSKCHPAADCREQPKLPEAVRMDCAGCHMPARIWMNVHFHTEAEPYVPPIRRYRHRIAVDRIATQDVLREWHAKQAGEANRDAAARLARELEAHWRRETDDREKAHRYYAAIESIREAIRVAPTDENRDRLRRLAATQREIVDTLDRALTLAGTDSDAARSPLLRVLELQPNNATALGRLGTIEAKRGNLDRAKDLWRQVAEADGDDSYGENMIGWQHYLDGRFADAIETFRRADAIEPFDLKIHYNWGLAYVRAGRFAEAVEKFRIARTIDPSDAGIHDGMVAALRGLGKNTEALDYAKRAARLTNYENAYLLESLGDSYGDTGDAARAREAYRRALALDPAPAAALELRRKIARLDSPPR